MAYNNHCDEQHQERDEDFHNHQKAGFPLVPYKLEQMLYHDSPPRKAATGLIRDIL